MSSLELAVEQRQWELVALCLALGLIKALNRLPPDAAGLIEVLDADGGDRNVRHG